MGKNTSHESHGKKRRDEKSSVALISVVSNTALVVFKLIVGLLIGSVSVISEAIHSGVDLVAALIAFFAVRKSGEPADADHRFGHGKFENLSGAIEAVLIFVAAAWIIIEAARKLMAPHEIEAPGWGVAIMLVSCLVNILVSRKLFQVGRRTDSVALLADAWHLRTDVYTSAGVMGGLALYTGGRWLAPGTDLRWVDPIVAILVALLIVKAAYDLTVQSVHGLVDQSLPDDELEAIRGTVTHCVKAGAPVALSYRKLRTRKSGAVRFVELELVVDARATVAETHAVADHVSRDIREAYAGAEVSVHVEPCAKDCDEDCRGVCVAPPVPVS